MIETTEKPLAIYERYPIRTWVGLVLLNAIASYVFAWDSTDEKWLQHAGMISAIVLCMVAYCHTSLRLLANRQRALHKYLVWVVLIKALISLLALMLPQLGSESSVWLLMLDIYAGAASIWFVNMVLSESTLFFFHFFTTLIDAFLHSIVVWAIALLLYIGFSKKPAA